MSNLDGNGGSPAARSLRDHLTEVHKCHRIFAEFESDRVGSIGSYGDLDLRGAGFRILRKE